MGTIGQKHKNQLLQKQSQYAIEPEVFTKDALGTEKGGGIVYLS
jgi:hypothetical protein